MRKIMKWHFGPPIYNTVWPNARVPTSETGIKSMDGNLYNRLRQISHVSWRLRRGKRVATLGIRFA